MAFQLLGSVGRRICEVDCFQVADDYLANIRDMGYLQFMGKQIKKSPFKAQFVIACKIPGQSFLSCHYSSQKHATCHVFFKKKN